MCVCVWSGPRPSSNPGQTWWLQSCVCVCGLALDLALTPAKHGGYSHVCVCGLALDLALTPAKHGGYSHVCVCGLALDLALTPAKHVGYSHVCVWSGPRPSSNPGQTWWLQSCVCVCVVWP